MQPRYAGALIPTVSALGKRHVVRRPRRRLRRVREALSLDCRELGAEFTDEVRDAWRGVRPHGRRHEGGHSATP
jgi:hypothetical protein